MARRCARKSHDPRHPQGVWVYTERAEPHRIRRRVNPVRRGMKRKTPADRRRKTPARRWGNAFRRRGGPLRPL